MENFLNFVIQLINYYPPEYVSLYLLAGLGVSLAKYSNTKLPSGILQFIFGVPFGVFIGLIIIALWPAYFSAIVFNKLSK